MVLRKLLGLFSRKRKEPKSIDDIIENLRQGWEDSIEFDEDLETIKEKRGKYEAEGLLANSVAEQWLYIRLQKCDCGVAYEPSQQALSEKDGLYYSTLWVKCEKCGNEKQFTFDINRYFGDPRLCGVDIINPFDRPSSIIDVSQWIYLSGVHRAMSEMESGNEKKMLLLMSFRYINEALKFYKSGSPYPPDESYFNKNAITGKMPDYNNLEKISMEKVVNFKSEIQEELKKLI